MAYWNTPQGFLDATFHHWYDMDGQYGRTCWDYGDFFWIKQVGRELSTGNTGQARGCWTVASARTRNAGSQFSLITNKNDLRVGDWVILNGGKYGHVACVYSIVDTGRTVCLQGQNQGAIRTQVTRVNHKLDTFLGAFRFKDWQGSESFLPSRGWWQKGDNDARIDKLCRFYANNFYGYFCKSASEAHRLLDGTYFGQYCEKWTKEFQRRTGLKADGCVGQLTYNKLKQFGFKG